MRSSIKLKPDNISKKDLWVIAGGVTLLALIYILRSKAVYAIGFPLDDSWIHQTYARNLALNHEWAYRPGVSSGGSTSPFWSSLLSIGYVVGLAPYIWTYLLGGICLFTLGIVCESVARSLVNSYQPRYPWVAVLLIGEWHLGWAAFSGMETILHGLIITFFFAILMTHSRRYLTLGLLAGLATWVRPDGLTLLAPVILFIYLFEKNMQARLRSIGRFAIGFGSLFVLYLFFNLFVGGAPFPSTFYAKQAEYAVWQSLPLLPRLGELILELITGPGLLLLPGAVIWGTLSFRNRLWGCSAATLWCLGYMLLYVMRLPVYQHGRYIIPAMPLFFLLGWVALIKFDGSKTFGRRHWVAQVVWRSSAVMIAVGFLFIGSNTYADDVAIIESEMVVTAKWVAQNIPPDAILAVHDVGALGYFDNHELIDLAGLISPEVIPFFRDEDRLRVFLSEKNVDYLITFPEFYPKMTQDSVAVFKSNSQFTHLLGKENMTVYQWKTP